jgi:hypothetical protein
VVFTNTEKIDVELVRQNSFIDHVSDNLRLRQRKRVFIGGDVAESVQTKLKNGRHMESRLFMGGVSQNWNRRYIGVPHIGYQFLR